MWYFVKKNYNNENIGFFTEKNYCQNPVLK